MQALDLCRHNFGHHVVQSVLEHGDQRPRVLFEVSNTETVTTS